MAFTSKVLALVARVLGKQYNINIAIGNYRTASTDGNTIYVPLVKGDSAIEMARGYIDHEAAHIRLTDFDIMPTKDFKGQLLNVIEDIRIEKAIGKDYPGCASNLRNLSTVLNDKYGVFEPNPANPSTSILAWVSCRGRVDTLAHDSMVASAQAAEPMARAILGQHFAEAQRLVAMIGRLPEDKSGTLAALKLRDEVMALIAEAKDDTENQPEPQPQEQKDDEGGQKADQTQDPGAPDASEPEAGDSGDKGQSGDSEDQDEKNDEGKSADSSPSEAVSKNASETEGGDSADQDGEEGGSEPNADSEGGSEDGGASEGEGDSGSNAGSDGDTNGADQASGASSSKGGSENVSDGGESQNQSQGSSAGFGPAEIKGAKEALEEALGPDAVVFGDVGQLLQELLQKEAVVNSYEISEIPKLPICSPHPVTNSAPFGDEHLVKTHTAQLRAQLQGLIQASKLKRSIPRRVGRKLDNRTLTRLSVGDDRLFVSREEKKGVNTAVLLILDGSGSMDYQVPGHKMHTATRACFVALEAMYSIPGVTAAAVEFNSTPNTVFSLCGWGQKPESRKFNHDSDGGTELSTALWLGWGELMSRPEPRKIAIVFSDGDTNSSDVAPSRAAIRRMRKDGIEMVGIGIQDAHLLNYLPNETRIINNLKELTPALLHLLREKLIAA